MIGGLGGAVCETLARRYPVPVARVGMRDCFGVSGKAEELFRHFHMTTEDIVAQAEKLFREKAARPVGAGIRL